MKCKKLLTCMTAFLMLLTPMGCGGGNDAMKNIKPPVYEKNGEFWLGGWDSPLNTIEDYRLAADMGLNYMFIDPSTIPSEYEKTFEYCKQSGINAIFSLGNEPLPRDDLDPSKLPGLKALNYYDEPSYDNIAKVAERFDYHMERFGSTLMAYANLNPSYAPVETICGSELAAQKGDKAQVTAADYKRYVEKYATDALDKITSGRKVLSYDHYPILFERGNYYNRPAWLTDTATIVNTAKAHNAEPHVFIQALEHLGIYPEMTEQSLRYQFWVYMAFGVRNFTYFTYRDSTLEGCGQSMVSRFESAKPNPQYYRAQKVNRELRAMENVYCNFDWVGMMPIEGSSDDAETDRSMEGIENALESIPFAEITASHNTLAGQFKDKEGRNGLLVTNYENPFHEIVDTVKIEFTDAKKAAVYTLGEEKIYVTDNGAIELRLEPGQGAFILPLK